MKRLLWAALLAIGLCVAMSRVVAAWDGCPDEYILINGNCMWIGPMI